MQLQVKGVSADDLATRPDLTLGLQAKIEAITDGVSVGHRNISSPKKSTPLEIKIDSVSPGQLSLMQNDHSVTPACVLIMVFSSDGWSSLWQYGR
jgi:hypothetical protein